MKDYPPGRFQWFYLLRSQHCLGRNALACCVSRTVFGCHVSHFPSVSWAATRGGFVIIDDWGSWPHAQLAVIDFLEQNGLATALHCLAKMMPRVNSSDQENSGIMDMLHDYDIILDYMTCW